MKLTVHTIFFRYLVWTQDLSFEGHTSRITKPECDGQPELVPFRGGYIEVVVTLGGSGMWLHRSGIPYDPDPASLHRQQTYNMECDGGTVPRQAWDGMPDISGYPNATEETFPPSGLTAGAVSRLSGEGHPELTRHDPKPKLIFLKLQETVGGVQFLGMSSGRRIRV